MIALIILAAVALVAVLGACVLSLRSAAAEQEAQARVQREYARQDRLDATYGPRAPRL